MTTVSPHTSLASLYPTRWLKAAQFIDAGKTSQVFTVTGISLEEVQPQPGSTETKPALHFQETDLLYLLNKTDAGTLQGAGLATAGDLVGAKVTIAVSNFRGKAVLRIKSASKAQPKPAGSNGSPKPAPAPAPATPAEEKPTPAPAQPARPAEPAPVDAVELWPPRGAAWVTHTRKGDAVDWSSSFWKLATSLHLDRPNALAIIEANGGDMEAAAQAVYLTRAA